MLKKLLYRTEYYELGTYVDGETFDEAEYIEYEVSVEKPRRWARYIVDPQRVLWDLYAPYRRYIRPRLPVKLDMAISLRLFGTPF